MVEYDNTNRGSLWANDKKTTDAQPDIKGQGECTCAHCGKSTALWLSAWYKTAAASGKEFLSIAFKAKDGQQATAPSPAAPLPTGFRRLAPGEPSPAPPAPYPEPETGGDGLPF